MSGLRKNEIINGSGKEVDFPLTLTLSPIGGEGITKGNHNALKGGFAVVGAGSPRPF